MSKEIKFRAWHKNANYMCQNVTTDLLDSDYLEFMQYTGLKDKNGTEVYEGDILLYNKSTKTVVAYKNGAYVRSYSNGNTYLLYDSFIENGVMIDFEAIGNIYGNPDLLEEN